MLFKGDGRFLAVKLQRVLALGGQGRVVAVQGQWPDWTAIRWASTPAVMLMPWAIRVGVGDDDGRAS